MIVGVMQPYLFPYLSYYQLAHHCEQFVFYDDVNFIKGGYINRNNILSNGAKQLITLPVEQASSFKKINELSFQNNTKKILRTIEQAYSKSPYFKDVYPLIVDVFTLTNRNVAFITRTSIIKVFEYLGLTLACVNSSELEYDREDSAEKKLYSICDLYGSNHYCNTLGGQALYCKEKFSQQGIELSFIEMNAIQYQQGKSDFVSHLSIIDVLMWNSKEQVINMFGQYKLV